MRRRVGVCAALCICGWNQLPYLNSSRLRNVGVLGDFEDVARFGSQLAGLQF